MTESAPSPASSAPPGHTGRFPLHTKIFIGLLIGAVLGLGVNFALAQLDPQSLPARILTTSIAVAEPLGKVFLRLVLMVVLPLVFSALALGVLELGDLRKVGRVGLRTLFFTAILSLTAVGIGVGLVGALQPGAKLPDAKRDELREKYAQQAGENVDKAQKAKSVAQTLLDVIPENPLQEMVGAIDGSSKGNGMLAVMFFSLVFGIALTATPDRTGTLVRCLEGLFDVAMVVIGFAMRIAPFAVACLIYAITATLGLDILRTLFWFVLTALLGLSLHLFVVYPIVIWTFTGRKPLDFFRDVSDAMVTAFGTSSSNATLPTALRVAEEKLKLPREISRFVLTVGATGNQNGTALYEGVVVLFLAQVFNVQLDIGQQIAVVLMSVLAGIGTAGVPGGSLPLIVVVMSSVGVPGEGIGIILGVDRVLDMCRTVLNVTGDLAVATCVAGRADPDAG
ncbi:MAG: dicarboxylate/amino acid:cation symporter [Planctomycetaceae bacterium]|nr:dicarboxylate/amino acid:cation symporter [Planctomycetaceae bacterium]